MDWLDVAMEEYRTIREEILKSIEIQQSILNFGTAALSVLTLAAFSERAGGLSIAVLMFVIPLASVLIVIMWVSEMTRMFRAGLFLAHLEPRVNGLFAGEPPPLQWENWAHTRDLPDVEKVQFRAILPAFLLLGLTALCTGTYKWYLTDVADWLPLVGAVGALLILASAAYWLAHELRRCHALRSYCELDDQPTTAASGSA